MRRSRVPESGGRWQMFARSVGAAVLLLWGLALPWSAEAADKTVRLAGRDRPSALRVAPVPDAAESSETRSRREIQNLRWESELLARRHLGPHGISQKGLALRERRLARLAKGTAAAEPETLRILLVRIGFEEDRSGSLTSVTTDGDFQLAPDPDVLFDPPPHDKSYFDAHMEGLAAYWKSMAARQLEIEWEVLPPGQNDSYKLSDIADYGPGSGGFWSIEKLELLVQDMIRVTDEQTQLDGSANLSDYDFDDPNTYVIFAHAGADWQSNLVWTEGDPDYSPNDIPTFFVTLGDEAQVDLTSIDPDTGEPGRMTECSVIPETTSQDDSTGSIAAALYHEFGHALGLPDLYSTFTGLPTVGYWDIMDTGTNLEAAVASITADQDTVVTVVTGLLPPQTSIWCKWFLGFAEEIRADGRMRDVNVASTHRQNSRLKALRIDVSPNEFFLVANRWNPPAAEGDWGLYSDPATGVVQFLGNFNGNTLVGNTHMYDFFLPWAGGVMIWRIRQDRVDAGMQFNTVQAFPEQLGIELIEADGIQDLGVFEFNTRGFLGSDNDAFRERTEFMVDFGDGPELIVYPRTATEFGPATLPPSRSSFGLPTGVHVEGIGQATRGGMDLLVGIEGLLVIGDGPAAFPVEIPAIGIDEIVARGDAASATRFDFAIGGEPTAALVVAAAAANGSGATGLYAYGADAAPVFATPRFVDLTAPLSGPPVAVEEFLGPGSDAALVTLAVDGTIQAFRPTLDGGSGLPAEYPATAFADSVDGPPLVITVATESFVVGTHRENNLIQVAEFTSSGSLDHPEWVVNFGLDETNNLRSYPVAGKVTDAGDATAIAYCTSRGLELRRESGQAILTTGEEWIRYPEAFRFSNPQERGHLLAWPESDRDGNGIADDGPDRFALVTDGGRMVLFEPDGGGRWTSRFLGGRIDSRPVAEPALGDIDGDGESELVVVTEKRVWARYLGGSDVFGFPVNVDDRWFLREDRRDTWVSSPVIADVDGDALNEVLVVSSFGLLHGIDSDGGVVGGFPQKRCGPQATAPLVVDVPDGALSRRALVLFDSLGDTLVSGNRTRTARLTALDLGESPAGDPAARPAEWLGRGGSVARAGRGALGGASSNQTLADAVRSQEPMVYPNPLRPEDGDTVYVRFYSGRAHAARLTVYSLEGEEIFSLESDVPGGSPAEVLWSARGLVPGPYLCRLDYDDGGGRGTDLMTLYIER